MKKAIVVLLVLAAAVVLLVAQSQPQRTYNIRTAYIYQEESLIIGESDLNCSFIIRASMPDAIRIIGGERMETHTESYGNDERMFINAGSRQGLKAGDVLQVLGRGPEISRPHGVGKLGRYFRKKALAVVADLYETRAVVALRGGCNLVQIGDFLVPYKPAQTLFERKPNYAMSRLPARGIEGEVVFNDIDTGIERDLGGDGSFLAIDIGSAQAKTGNYLLFFRRLGSGLPPLILGLGVVVAAEKDASTVKVLDSSTEILKGDRVVLVTFSKTQPGQTAAGQEALPIVQTIEGEAPAAGAPVAAPTQALLLELLFDFDSAALRPENAADLEKVKEAVAGKGAYTVTLRGYTCGIGSETYNLKLAQQRVEAIKAALVGQYGIEAARVETFYYGEKESAYDNTAESERRKNRRVTIEVSVQ